MKKIFLFLAIVFLPGIGINAQKRICKISPLTVNGLDTRFDINVELKYENDSLYYLLNNNEMFVGYDYKTQLKYNDSQFIQSYTYNKNSYFRDSFIKGSLIVGEMFGNNLWWGGWGNSYVYEYDENEFMVKLYILGYKDFVDSEEKHLQGMWDFAWENENIISGKLYKDDELVADFNCTYSDKICENKYSCMNSPLYEMLSYSETVPLGYFYNGSLGRTCKNYLQSIHYNIKDEEAFDKIDMFNFLGLIDHEYEYEFDSEGYPVKIIDTLNNHTMEIGWETYDDIKSPELDKLSNQPAPVYDLQGRRLSQKPQKGIYIKNGRKIIEK